MVANGNDSKLDRTDKTEDRFSRWNVTVYLLEMTKLNEIIWSIDDIWEGNGSSKRSKLLGTYALTNAIMDLSQMSVREKFRVWIRVQSWHKWDIRMFKTCNI